MLCITSFVRKFECHSFREHYYVQLVGWVLAWVLLFLIHCVTIIVVTPCVGSLVHHSLSELHRLLPFAWVSSRITHHVSTIVFHSSTVRNLMCILHCVSITVDHSSSEYNHVSPLAWMSLSITLWLSIHFCRSFHEHFRL